MARTRMGPPYYNLALWKFAESIFWRLRAGYYMPEETIRKDVARLYQVLDRTIQKLCVVKTMSLVRPDNPHYEFRITESDAVRISIAP